MEIINTVGTWAIVILAAPAAMVIGYVFVLLLLAVAVGVLFVVVWPFVLLFGDTPDDSYDKEGRR